MYKCEMCGAVFDEPLIKEGYEPMPDFFYEPFGEPLCPICGQPYFKEMDGKDERSD